MATTLTTRETAGTGATVKGSPLTNAEIDGNFLSLADNKLEASNNLSDLTDTTAAKANLELSGMAAQDSDDVDITGGTIIGITNLVATGGELTGITNFASSSVDITGGNITGIVDLLIADGGTGASSASAARQNLGVEIGLDVQESVEIVNEVTSTDSFYPSLLNATSGNLPSTVQVSDTKLFYQPSTGTLNATNYNTLSDIAFKENINPIEDSLEKIMSLNPVEFDWKDNGNHSSGVIAQELENVLPHLVTTSSNGVKSVNYLGLSVYLISAIKELTQVINKQKDD